jgi:hypothetical protein
MADHLTHLAARLRTAPGFIAHELRRLNRQQIAEQLHIDQAAVIQLLLCHSPRPDQHAGDIKQIAAHMGTNAGTLTALLSDQGAARDSHPPRLGSGCYHPPRRKSHTM